MATPVHDERQPTFLRPPHVVELLPRRRQQALQLRDAALAGGPPQVRNLILL
jgi:hypothetical protein